MKIFPQLIFKASGLLLVIFLFIGASCDQSVSETKKHDPGTAEMCRIAFYNVENLFDVFDDPRKKDEDFTPDGKLKWNEERYHSKLNHIADVMDALPGALPAFIGMCEIENRKVLDDLTRENKLLPGNYAVIHKDSPDERGIDVAAIYDSTLMKIDYFHYTTINLPDDTDPYTRDLLYVKASMHEETIHLFINHWPSRGGGQQESEKNRIAVANVLESLSGKILDADKDARILIMGDFNDHPTDKSIAEVLNAGINPTNTYYNFMYDDHAKKTGSYFYKGEWGALDQFISSKGLVKAKNGWTASEEDTKIFYDDMILFKDKEGVMRPNRTYAGDDYKGGYSDHLPIYMDLKWK